MGGDLVMFAYDKARWEHWFCNVLYGFVLILQISHSHHGLRHWFLNFTFLQDTVSMV